MAVGGSSIRRNWKNIQLMYILSLGFPLSVWSVVSVCWNGVHMVYGVLEGDQSSYYPFSYILIAISILLCKR